MAAYRVSKNGLEDLCELLGFGDGEMAGVVFAAIDFEACHNLRHAYQMSIDSDFGISTLDTRDLIPNPLNKDPSEMISTRAFFTGRETRWQKAIQRARFAVPERVSIYALADRIHSCLDAQDLSTDAGQRRTFAIVQHTNDESLGLHTLRIMKKRGPESVQTALDIGKINAELIDGISSLHLTLGKLADELGVPFETEDFHSAGNDANCILRILRLLAVRHQQGRPCTETHTRLLNLLQQIARAPLPPRKTDAEIE